MRLSPVVVALLALVLVGVLVGSAVAVRAQGATPTADLEANKALARRFHDDIFDQGNLAAADEILSPDFVWHSPPDEANPVRGVEEVKQQATYFLTLIPDLVLSDDDVIAEGDRVAIRWTLRGTAQTEAGPVPVSFTGIDIFRIEDGKLAELWQNYDQAGFMAQLGQAPAAATPAS